MNSEYDVVVIGAGAAGIAAARRLAGTRLSILLIEASDRVGGRAWTQEIAGMPIDLGCGWLHSGERNPWTAIAEGSGFAVDRSDSAWRVQYRDLGFSATEQDQADAAWRAWRDRLDDAPPASDRASDALAPGDPWNAYAEALSGYINGAALDRLSVADFLAYDRAASETNWRVPAGYGTLIAASLPLVPTMLSTPVTAIDPGGARIAIETRGGTILARTAIVTVSTAVLAGGAIRMPTSLDDRLHAAACLPLGLADKLFLAIEGFGEGSGPFAPETHLLGNPRRAGTGSYYIMPFGRPLIECFYGGSGARTLERAGLDDAFAFARDELAALFGNDVRGHLRALAGSAWCRMGRIGGSYSHALPGESAQRAVLARPFDDRLLFAGEATHATDFSTAHGACESGVRAAEQAIAARAAM